MPRKPKPKPQKKLKAAVPVNGKTISVTLYPPKPPRTSWYAYRIAVKSREELESELQQAVSRKDYQRATQLSAELASRRAP